MKVFRQATGVAETHIGEETVLLHLKSGEYYGLNEVGSHLWRLLHDGASLETLVASVSKAYSEEHAIVLSDVREILKNLLSEGLVIKSSELTVRSK